MRHAKAIAEIRAFNRFYTNLLGVVDQHILDSPYSLTEVRIMFEIYHDRNVTARTIRNYVRVDEGYLSRTIDKLARQGLIVRTQSPRDGRTFLLSLSKKGKKEFLALNQKSQNAIDSMIKNLSPAEIREFVSLVGRIKQLFTKDRTLESIS